jgi:ABC-type dipeptide/oligopeptide/nickel transport system ATPase component
MNASTSLVVADRLTLDYVTPGRRVRALDGVSLSVAAGARLGIVGESGSGKSTLGAAVGRLLPANAVLDAGSLVVDGVDVFASDRPTLRALRRDVLGFIPQDPIGALDPTMRIGRQLALAAGLGRGAAARADVVRMLDEVKIRDPERVTRLYPHQVSGGMAQRVVVAMTMSRRPRLLVADEPTASLDSLVRDDVLALIFGLAAEHGSTVIWLSHDLQAVARWCDRVAVMTGGTVVEEGPADRVLRQPEHEYTRRLVAADPRRARLTSATHPLATDLIEEVPA